MGRITSESRIPSRICCLPIVSILPCFLLLNEFCWIFPILVRYPPIPLSGQVPQHILFSTPRAPSWIWKSILVIPAFLPETHLGMDKGFDSGWWDERRRSLVCFWKNVMILKKEKRKTVSWRSLNVFMCPDEMLRIYNIKSSGYWNDDKPIQGERQSQFIGFQRSGYYPHSESITLLDLMLYELFIC